MKKKILFAGLIALLTTMMTSCLVVFPDDDYYYGSSSTSSYDYYKYGQVVVKNETRYGYISEISYGINDGANSYWTLAWDDGHDYDYRAVDAGSSKTYYSCKMPVGYTDIRVTVIYPEGSGRYTYQDFIFENEYISKNYTTYLTVSDSNTCLPR